MSYRMLRTAYYGLLMQVPTSALEPEVAKVTSESHLYYNKGL